MTEGRDLCHHFAEFAASASYDRLPAHAVEGAKRSILDTLGVILGASGMEPAARCAIDLALESGGKAESSVLAFGSRIPAPMAAFANGAMAHSLDYDDQTPWGQHASSSLIPAVLAVAERKGGISGKELITAVAIGHLRQVSGSCNWTPPGRSSPGFGRRAACRPGMLRASV